MTPEEEVIVLKGRITALIRKDIPELRAEVIRQNQRAWNFREERDQLKAALLDVLDGVADRLIEEGLR